MTATAKYLTILKSWTTRNPDGSIKDFGLKTIRHKESYAQWNDTKNDWDYIKVPCNCEICASSYEVVSTSLTLAAEISNVTGVGV